MLNIYAAIFYTFEMDGNITNFLVRKKKGAKLGFNKSNLIFYSGLKFKSEWESCKFVTKFTRRHFVKTWWKGFIWKYCSLILTFHAANLLKPDEKVLHGNIAQL